MGRFYVSVVQAILLFKSLTWVVTPPINQILGGFHHRLARQILDKMHQRLAERTLYYPPLGDAMMIAGLKEIGTYISRPQNMVVQYIATHLIMYL